MIYTPQDNPLEAFILACFIVLIGIIGGYFWHYLMIVALLFWFQYTAVLSYLQFKHKSKHSYNDITEALLHPQVRFFIFEFFAVLGILFLLINQSVLVGGLVLIIWWLFSLNFYVYYRINKHHSK
jgi:hypothetical protein